MITLNNNTVELEKNGYLDRPIDPSLDIITEIKRLKEEHNMVLLAHYYQEGDIQDIADFVGDSLALAQEVVKTKADIIVFAGVHFMAETAKILHPNKKVLLPDLKAGCSLADSAPPELFRKFREQHPDHLVISYINCTAAIKAQTDIICTSSNARMIVESLPQDQKILFAPDKNLGAYLNRVTGKNMLLWNGSCMVHEIFSLEKTTKLKHLHPHAQVIAHPECEESLLALADFIGSTSELLKYTKNTNHTCFIVLTENGILHQMQKNSPSKIFIPGPPTNTCACNECPHMKLNTIEKLYLCMLYQLPEIILEPAIIERAYKPIARMLEITARGAK
ncbi:MAG: quinolinate synthase NadA [Phycisphaerales bacterium]|nr:quinolinate synthase NadA [Phycisphaerales bacterium]